MLYRTLLRLVQRGAAEGLEAKLDIFFAAGKLEQEQYLELLGMLQQL